jgi:hypothetical protein
MRRSRAVVCRSRNASPPAFVAGVSYIGKGRSRSWFHIKPLVDQNAEPSHRDWRRCEIADRQETEHKQFAAPDEVREFPNGRAEILSIGGGEVGRLVFEPGWRWSTDVKPIAHTESCEAPHFQYHVSGQLAIRMYDGTEMIAGPGEITSLPEGHDAWVVGDEPAIVDWYGASNYATG